MHEPARGASGDSRVHFRTAEVIYTTSRRQTHTRQTRRRRREGHKKGGGVYVQRGEGEGGGERGVCFE